MSILFLALLNMSAALVCPDGGTCEDRNTCCKNPAGGYSCCPLPHVRSGLTAVICPDSRYQCPDGATCCQLPDGSWGCCLLSSAVCCADKIHCCPEGSKCDLTHSRCVSPSQQLLPMMQKVPASRRAAAPVICPDGKSSCSEGATCCQLTSGEYGCCPYPQAVCCSDHLHCCPTGTRCDLALSVCVAGPGGPSPASKIIAALGPEPKSSGQVFAGVFGAGRPVFLLNRPRCSGSPGVATTPVLPFLPDDTKCDDTASCPGDYTCCRTLKGGWACCPLAQAVCCSDHTHCCPHNTICNLQERTCNSQSGGRPPLRWVEKVPALSWAGRGEQCDKQTSCPGGSTCCKNASGQWACCPSPQAVCCSDHLHCCPRGYRCNLAAQTCDKAGGASLPWLLKVPALVEPSPALPAQLAEVVCDNQTSCPSHTTCCFVQKWQKFGCCPVPNVGPAVQRHRRRGQALTFARPQAVCCEGGSHCCPMGHRCDPYRSSCSKGPLVTPWFTKLSAVTQPGAPTDIKCDDSSRCPAGTTCCKLQSGGWGCCPLVKAVCCEDHEHCCPQGYSCRMETGTCEKKNHGAPVFSVPQRRLLPSGAGRPEGLAPCGGTGEFHCPKEDTCCPTSATEWACCPSPGAVCCSDHKHCCPAGFSCDLKAGGCVRDPSPWDAWFHRPVRSRL
ncbi:unnamed protein product [Tetraodon nigroviridis]|uniref:(spotted green pufferfish) hypothetical protein n=1 Tax=Tetraodon nigroviridis TaxID=99883 RepID=Q4S8K6_TETNG|nr:unnamed protein product [Tetraodon nigroviridis]